MHSDTDYLWKGTEVAPDGTTLEHNQLRDVTTLIIELKRILANYAEVLKEDNVRQDMQRLEHWLETERNGPAPAGVISQSALLWLKRLRDRIKLLAEESQRLESEGGNPATPEQTRKIEELLNIVRTIDAVTDERMASNPINH